MKTQRRTAAPPLAGLSDYARDARKLAMAPFSNFKVGAALLTTDGEIITGCNIESATYGLTLCAERIAVFKAVSEGFRKFTAIAVVADSHIVTPPCGVMPSGAVGTVRGHLGPHRGSQGPQEDDAPVDAPPRTVR